MVGLGGRSSLIWPCLLMVLWAPLGRWCYCYRGAIGALGYVVAVGRHIQRYLEDMIGDLYELEWWRINRIYSTVFGPEFLDTMDLDEALMHQ